MTEVEWLAATDPWPMHEYLRETVSDRKIRLFGCACVREVWDYILDEALRQATETAERFADGLATVEQLREAREMADAAYQGMGDSIADHSAIAIGGLCQPKPYLPMGHGSSAGIAAVAAEAWSNREIPFHVAWDKAKKGHCKLFRDIIGNPFSPITLNPSWLTSTVHALAQGIYEERAFDRMPILADALQDADCDIEDILNHCRQPGEHVRGCWVVDLLIGRT